MNNTTTPRGEATDRIMEFLIWSWEKQYVTVPVLTQATGLSGPELYGAVRKLVSHFKVMEYSNRGEYRILDLDGYFNPPVPDAPTRYNSALLYHR